MSALQQITFNREAVNTKIPEPKLSRNQRIVLQCLRSAGRGLTYDEIRLRLVKAGLSTVDNRLRELRQLGYVESYRDKSDQQIRFYPTEKRELD